MLRFSAEQFAQLGRLQFLRKADHVLANNIPVWAQSDYPGRREFAEMCLDRSARYGLRSEQSVLLYTLCAVWLGQMFEEASPLLMRLLNSPLPELRKSHAMCDWVRDQLRPNASPVTGDAAIRRSLELTTPWGRR